MKLTQHTSRTKPDMPMGKPWDINTKRLGHAHYEIPLGTKHCGTILASLFGGTTKHLDNVGEGPNFMTTYLAGTTLHFCLSCPGVAYVCYNEVPKCCLRVAQAVYLPGPCSYVKKTDVSHTLASKNMEYLSFITRKCSGINTGHRAQL